MITSVIIILLFLGVLVLVIRMYTFKGMVYTPEEVADIIEKFLDGSGGEWDWDDFTSITIKDAYLDGIRCKCAHCETNIHLKDQTSTVAMRVQQLCETL